MTSHHLFVFAGNSFYSNTLTKVSTAETNYLKLLWTILIKKSNRHTHHSFIIVWNSICIGYVKSIIIFVMNIPCFL